MSRMKCDSNGKKVIADPAADYDTMQREPASAGAPV
jgi:hypothetical protein